MAKNRNHHLEKRGDVWYLVIMVEGRRIKKALSTSVTEARRLRDEHINEVQLNGDIRKPEPTKTVKLFGEVAQQWAKIKQAKVKASTLRDYRSAMNTYILPKFGNTPIDQITFLMLKNS